MKELWVLALVFHVVELAGVVHDHTHLTMYSMGKLMMKRQFPSPPKPPESPKPPGSPKPPNPGCNLGMVCDQTKQIKAIFEQLKDAVKKQGKEMESLFEPIEQKISKIEGNLGMLGQQVDQSDKMVKKYQEATSLQFMKLGEQAKQMAVTLAEQSGALEKTLKKFEIETTKTDEKNRNQAEKLSGLEHDQAKAIEAVRWPGTPIPPAPVIKTSPKIANAAAQLTMKISQKEAQLKEMELDKIGFDEKSKIQETKLGEVEGKRATADARVKELDAKVKQQMQLREGLQNEVKRTEGLMAEMKRQQTSAENKLRAAANDIATLEKNGEQGIDEFANIATKLPDIVQKVNKADRLLDDFEKRLSDTDNKQDGAGSPPCNG